MTKPAEWERRDRAEEVSVRELGRNIGYGRTMQLCEQLWGEDLDAKGLSPGGAHATYCCAAFLVPCPGCAPARARGEHCDWCCGAGRVTKRVAQAIEDALLAQIKSKLP